MRYGRFPGRFFALLVGALSYAVFPAKSMRRLASRSYFLAHARRTVAMDGALGFFGVFLSLVFMSLLLVPGLSVPFPISSRIRILGARPYVGTASPMA